MAALGRLFNIHNSHESSLLRPHAFANKRRVTKKTRTTKKCLKLYSFCETFWLNNCNHCVAWQKIVGLIRYYFFYFCVSAFIGEFSSPTQESSKDKKNSLSQKGPLYCIIWWCMGDFIFNLEQNPNFLYQISWDCPLKDGDARIKQRQNRRTPLCVR